MMYAVVRLRGSVGASMEIIDTLEMLNLKRKFDCTLVPEKESYRGMLKKVRNFVTWGEINEGVLEEISRKGTEPEKESFDPSDLEGLESKPIISLSPPSQGFKGSTKKIYPDGEAGYRGEKINQLLERMI